MNKTIAFKATTCCYKCEGKGDAVMLIHGFVEEGSMWDEVVKVLSKNYKVIVPDLPGFGRSGLLANTKLSMELYAKYLFEILKEEKIGHAVMLGHSMGGYITLSFAKKYGKMLRGFGLINSHCFADTPEKKISRRKAIAFVKKHGTKVFVSELYHSIFHDVFKKKGAKTIQALIDKAVKYSPEAVMRNNEAMMNRRDKSEVLKEAKVPVLLVNGKQDESAPIGYTLKQAIYPGIADVHFFDNCKHMCVFERKTETIKLIKVFLERIEVFE